MEALERLFSGLRASTSGLSAERVRIDAIAENIANARTTSTPEGGPYRRKVVVFEPLLEQALRGSPRDRSRVVGVREPRVVEDTQTPFQRILEPGHPDADSEGMVSYPNVNSVLEMADLITALRAYEANLAAQESFLQMAERALELSR